MNTVFSCFGLEVATTETELEVTGLGVSDVTGLHRHGWISVVLLPTSLILVYVLVVCMHTCSFTRMWANVHVGVHACVCIWRSEVGIRCLLW